MFCVMHNLPFLLMDFLPNLLRVCCPDSEIAKAIKCSRTKATQITEQLASMSNAHIVKQLKTSKFSLIVDETTDVSCRKALVLVVRYFENLAGLVRDRFLCLIELEKCDAESIYQNIKSFFLTNNIPIQNLIGLATDGANTMAGHLTGLKTKLTKDTNLFYLKCPCHSLHLCTAYACKKLPGEVESLCRNVYSYFSWSPKRVQEFKEFQEYCNIKPHKMLGLALTRWLSLQQVVLRIIEQWDALQLYFLSHCIEVNDIKPKDLANLMAMKETKAYMLFLTYILKIVNDLNIEFQSDSIRLPFLYRKLEAVVQLILTNFMCYQHVKNVPLESLEFKDSNYFLPIEKVFMGMKAETFTDNHNIEKSKICEIKKNVRCFYIELISQILQRFDFSRTDIKSLEIITPSKILSDDELSIAPLLTHFSYLLECEPDEIISQWTSAVAERKFFELSLIKNKLRNKLEFKTLNNIMLCKELFNNKDMHYVWSKKDSPNI
ncbi:zinc finger MYM-type protein 6-like [Teleopsis dalmanni]|uniref:zinc finger MYM-type protein 6-like n=1 Tax=Teleopsis dalmanni TaxID=139649 RepID=UPI0018CE3EC1|nr:zinc finger MYM-type protein 6-like [Teleopsis dalmanni]